MAKKTANVLGTFGKIDGSVTAGTVKLTFTGDEHGESLSLAFKDECQMTLPYKEIRAIANKAKTQMLFGAQKSMGEYWEDEALTSGLYIAGKGNPFPKKGEVHINFRSDGGNELLSIAFEDKGEISVPYLSVKAFVSGT